MKPHGALVAGGDQAIEPGSRVLVHLAIHLSDGTEALSTFGEEPLDLSIGDGTLTPGLERLLFGLRSGADEHFLADGNDLYGLRSPDQILWLERDAFPDGLTPAPGQVISFDTPGGQETAGVVLAADGDRVQLDFNHPLAGRSLQIRIQVLGVSAPDNETEIP